MNKVKCLDAFMVLGPSGVGKSTLLRRLLHEHSNRLGYSVSHTSRPPRAGEVDGIHYHFVDEPTILKMHEQNELVELGHIHGRYYGTSVAALKKVQGEGKICILELDVNAIETIRNNPNIHSLCVFLTADPEVLKNRISSRGGVSEEELKTRLATAEYELNYVREHPSYFHCIIKNDDVDIAYTKLVDFISQSMAACGMEPLDSNTASL